MVVISWLLADRNFPYVVALLVVAASLLGAALGLAVTWLAENLRSRWASQVLIEWEGLE